MLCAQIDLMDKEAPNQLQQSRSRKAQPSGGDGGVQEEGLQATASGGMYIQLLT